MNCGQGRKCKLRNSEKTIPSTLQIQPFWQQENAYAASVMSSSFSLFAVDFLGTETS
jgi:hypothetical protein